MANEEYITQWNNTGGPSALRNRKIFPASEKTFQTQSTALSKDKTSQAAGHLSDDDTQSSNGTSAQCPARGNVNNGPQSRVLLMLVVGLSFSTRLYKITEPAHVWWVRVLCVHACGFSPSQCDICFSMMTCFGVPAGMRRTLERWEATTSTGLSFLMSTLLLEKWDGRLSLFA